MFTNKLLSLSALLLLGIALLSTTGCGGGGGLILIEPLADVEVENQHAPAGLPIFDRYVIDWRMWPTGHAMPAFNQLAGPDIAPLEIRDVGNWVEDYYDAQAQVSIFLGPPSIDTFSTVFVQGGSTTRFGVF